MNKPKISIIIPVYNAEKYIKTCITALLKQTEQNIEIIIVDDDSQDNSLKIMQKLTLSDNRIKIFHTPNGGPGAARQYGLNHAQGEFIMFCDADDYYREDMCAKMLSEIQKYNADFGVCNLLIAGTESQSSHSSPSSVFINYNEKNIPITGCALLCHIFRKDIIDRYGITFPKVYYSEDLAFIFKYVYISKSYFRLDEQLYIHIVNQNSLMKTASQNISKVISALDSYFDIADFLKRNNLWQTFEQDFYCKLERALVYTVSAIPESDVAKIISRTAFLLQDKNMTPNFELLCAIQAQNPKKLRKFAKTTNLARTRRISFCNATVIKIKNTPNAKKIYFLGIPVYKRVY